MNLRQSYVPTSTLLKYYIMTPAPYCQKCEFPFKQMGACPNPDKSIIYAYVSLLPYIIPIAYAAIFLFTRRISHIKIFFMLASAYIIGDKLLKNVFKNPRPQFSCKSSFGMPSSHMVVMASYTFYQIRYGQITFLQKILWFLLTVLQAFARIQLNYHTQAQVVGGTVFGMVYTAFFKLIWSSIQDFLVKLPLLRSILKAEAAYNKDK